MADLVQSRSGKALEPSAGAGHLVKVLEDSYPHLLIDAVELDESFSPVCRASVLHQDFFTFAPHHLSEYQVVFGNPPYVAYKEVEEATRISAQSVKAAYSDKTNLYHLFIDRLIDVLAPLGEMVLIVPKEWLYTTSAAPLRARLSALGALTHVVDCGEEKLFDDASVPALLIFRWVKSLPQASVSFAPDSLSAQSGLFSPRQLLVSDQRWMLLPPDLVPVVSSFSRLSDQFDVRVGLVTGMDKVFKLASAGLVEAECVQYQVDTSRTAVPFVNVNNFAPDVLPPRAAAHLAAHKPALLARRIAHFDESNWYKYGAVRNDEHMRSAAPRFFALVKTRSPQPFFTVPGAKFFSGGVLGIFQKESACVPVDLAVRVLNSPRYRPVLEGMFLTSADKVSLQPATLSDAPFPSTSEQALNFLQG